jgi:hypothetical protein
MLFFHERARLLETALALSAVVVLSSCGTDDGFGKRYPVSGSVTYNGKPLEKGSINFFPDDPRGMGAAGVIGNGSYALSMAGGNDGARAGKYKVTVTAKEDSTAKAKADFDKASKGTGQDFVPRQFAANAQAKAKSLIPAGYSDVKTTTLTAEVLEKPNTLDFKLSDAEAPAAPIAAPAGKGGRAARRGE